LIIKLGAIGDVLRTTSILQGLKEKYPKANISWLTKENAHDLLKNNPFIHKIYTKKPLKRFDLIINLDEDHEACKLATELSDNIIGFYLKENKVTPTETAKTWYNMSNLGKKPQNDILKKENKKTYQQHMFDIIGIKPKQYDTLLNLTEEELNFGRNFAKKHNIKQDGIVIGLNTGAGKRWKLKKWGIEKTAKLAEKIFKELNANIILFGGSEETERNKKILSLIKTPTIDAGCNNSLMQFASLIDLCDILVTSDSLAMHIGIALKKKVVVLFGPTSSTEIKIYKRGKKIMPRLECTCCYKKTCNKKPNCMDLIDMDDVFEAVKELA